MRKVGTIAGGVGLVVLALLWSEGAALARDGASHVVPSLSPSPPRTAITDFVQLRQAIWAWGVAAVTSAEFWLGAAGGVILAEAIRFSWRWICKVCGGAITAADFVVQHRLMVVVTACASYFVVAHFIA